GSLSEGEAVRDQRLKLHMTRAEECDGLRKFLTVAKRPQERDFMQDQATDVKLHLLLIQRRHGQRATWPHQPQGLRKCHRDPRTVKDNIRGGGPPSWPKAKEGTNLLDDIACGRI